MAGHSAWNPVRGDDGAADPGLAGALADFAAGRRAEHDVLTRLAGSRLLVPVAPMPAGGGQPGARELAMLRLVGADGRPAIVAFTGLDALTRWQRDARPVPADAAVIWQAAAGQSCAVVIDVAGPVPLAVEGARLAALASGAAVPLPHADPDVRAVVAAAVAAHAPGATFMLRPAPAGGGPTADCDLVLELTLPPGLPAAQAGQAAGRAGQAAMAGLGTRLRRGIAITLA